MTEETNSSKSHLICNLERDDILVKLVKGISGIKSNGSSIFI